MTMQTGAPPRRDEATFGRVEPPAEETRLAPPDYGPNRFEVDELLAQARVLTPAGARQLASSVAWRWVPIGVPAGSIAAARSAAIAAGRAAGRGPALEAAQAAARDVALGSAGGRETTTRTAHAESAVAALGIAIVGAVVSELAGLTVLALVLLVGAMVSGVLLLLIESAYVRRLRLTSAASAAALGLVTRDLIEPGEFELLVGPWRSVIRD